VDDVEVVDTTEAGGDFFQGLGDDGSGGLGQPGDIEAGGGADDFANGERRTTSTIPYLWNTALRNWKLLSAASWGFSVWV
jgi:hypothetical protein